MSEVKIKNRPLRGGFQGGRARGRKARKKSSVGRVKKKKKHSARRGSMIRPHHVPLWGGKRKGKMGGLKKRTRTSKEQGKRIKR